jgi:hypothetical protein
MRDLAHLARYRIPLRGYLGDAHNGAFAIPSPRTGSQVVLHVLSSDGEDWDHVSVSIRGQKRLPTWCEMAYVRELFFEPEETCMQLHPPVADHINNGEVLHLWRPQSAEIPRPPAWMVGVKYVTPAEVAAIANETRTVRRRYGGGRK